MNQGNNWLNIFEKMQLVELFIHLKMSVKLSAKLQKVYRIIRLHFPSRCLNSIFDLKSDDNERNSNIIALRKWIEGLREALFVIKEETFCQNSQSQSFDLGIRMFNKIPKQYSNKKTACLYFVSNPDGSFLHGIMFDVYTCGYDKILEHCLTPILRTSTNEFTRVGVGPDLNDIVGDTSSNIGILTRAVVRDSPSIYIPTPALNIYSHLGDEDILKLLEKYVKIWSDLIGTVLDPPILGNNDVLGIIDLWHEKVRVCNDVFQQIQSQRVRDVLIRLDNIKNPISSSFGITLKQFYFVRVEAQERSNLYSILRPYLEKISITEDVTLLCRPIVHIVYKMWKRSHYFRGKDEINQILFQVSELVLTRLVKDGSSLRILFSRKQYQDAIEELQKIVKSIGILKSSFLLYRNRARNELPNDRSWDISMKIAFSRVDLLLDRCRCLLEVASVCDAYFVLNKLHLPTVSLKYRVLSSGVSFIMTRFNLLLLDIMKFDDPLDLSSEDHKRFIDEIISFKVNVENLDNQLSTIFEKAFQLSSHEGFSCVVRIYRTFDMMLSCRIVSKYLHKCANSMRESIVEALRNIYTGIVTNNELTRTKIHSFLDDNVYFRFLHDFDQFTRSMDGMKSIRKLSSSELKPFLIDEFCEITSGTIPGDAFLELPKMCEERVINSNVVNTYCTMFRSIQDFQGCEEFELFSPIFYLLPKPEELVRYKAFASTYLNVLQTVFRMLQIFAYNSSQVARAVDGWNLKSDYFTPILPNQSIDECFRANQLSHASLVKKSCENLGRLFEEIKSFICNLFDNEAAFTRYFRIIRSKLFAGIHTTVVKSLESLLDVLHGRHEQAVIVGNINIDGDVIRVVPDSHIVGDFKSFRSCVYSWLNIVLSLEKVLHGNSSRTGFYVREIFHSLKIRQLLKKIDSRLLQMEADCQYLECNRLERFHSLSRIDAMIKHLKIKPNIVDTSYLVPEILATSARILRELTALQEDLLNFLLSSPQLSIVFLNKCFSRNVGIILRKNADKIDSKLYCLLNICNAQVSNHDSRHDPNNRQLDQALKEIYLIERFRKCFRLRR